jgi:hypothetical protein
MTLKIPAGVLAVFAVFVISPIDAATVHANSQIIGCSGFDVITIGEGVVYETGFDPDDKVAARVEHYVWDDWAYQWWGPMADQTPYENSIAVAYVQAPGDQYNNAAAAWAMGWQWEAATGQVYPEPWILGTSYCF